MKKILDEYLEHLNESLFSKTLTARDILAIIELIISILFFLLFLAYIFSISNNRKLSKKIYEITGVKYPVKILPEKVPNAFCFGGLGKTIVVTKGLMDLYTEREVIAVCLHEVGHITSLDTVKNIVVASGSIGIGGYTTLKFIDATSKTVKSNRILTVFTYVLVVLLFFWVATKVPGILFGKVQEYKSDRNAVKYGYGRDLMSALAKLDKYIQNEFKKQKPNKLTILFDKLQRLLDVRPSIKNRIDKLLESVEVYEAMLKHDKEQLKKLVKKYLLV